MIALVLTAACAGVGPNASVQPVARAPELVVLMRDMTDLAFEWEFFDSHSDSIGAGQVVARNASWCAKVPIPATAQSVRLFNGLEDLAVNPAKEPYWTLRLTPTGAFARSARAPC